LLIFLNNIIKLNIKTIEHVDGTDDALVRT
jgi:hypothetical protein